MAELILRTRPIGAPEGSQNLTTYIVEKATLLIIRPCPGKPGQIYGQAAREISTLQLNSFTELTPRAYQPHSL